MKEVLVPIFTEEYKIRVVIGTVEELAKYVLKYCEGWDYDNALKHCQNTRGSAFNTLPKKHPLITLDIDLPYELALATLPHEASHAFHFLIEYMGIEDPTDELRGHAISAVVRHTLKKMLGKKKLYVK
jgi:hypothetical protein